MMSYFNFLVANGLLDEEPVVVEEPVAIEKPVVVEETNIVSQRSLSGGEASFTPRQGEGELHEQSAAAEIPLLSQPPQAAEPPLPLVQNEVPSLELPSIEVLSEDFHFPEWQTFEGIFCSSFNKEL